MAALFVPASIAAQQGPDRAFIDSLLAQLEVNHPAELAKRCQTQAGPLRRLCSGLISLKSNELNNDRNVVMEAELQLRQVVESRNDWAVGWYALGIARLGLARAGVLAKPGSLQILGESWQAGAGRALTRAVELDTTFDAAIVALALAPIPREGAAILVDRRSMLRRVRGHLGPAPLVGAAMVERATGARDSAAALLERALQRGGIDSGTVALELAREWHAVNRSAAGREILWRGAGIPSDDARAQYRVQLAWVASPAELAEWDSTPTGGRPAWLKRFWSSRDVREGWLEGTRLIEHYRRVEHSFTHFVLSLPPSGRHRMITRSSGIDLLGMELFLRRLEGAEGLSLRLDLERSGDEAGVRALSQATVIREQLRSLGIDGPFRSFRGNSDLLDDRGLIWIRHGTPDRAGRTAGGEALEVWVYELAGGPLVLQFREENFDGQVGASTLVPTLIDTPGWSRDQFCGLSQSLCAFDTSKIDEPGGSLVVGAGTLTDGGRLNPAFIARVVSEGLENIAQATTTDGHPRDFASRVSPVVQVYGLRKLTSNRGVVVAAFSLPGEQLLFERPPEAGGRVVYPVRFVLSVLSADGVRRDLDTLRHFAVRAPLEKGQFLNGVLEMPLRDGRYEASLAITQPDGRGAVASLPALAVPSHNDRLAISSLVLGKTGSGVNWSSGTESVPLNPMNAYIGGEQVELYYQLSGVTPGQEYQTRVEVREPTGTDAKTVLTLTFDDTPRASLVEVTRSIDLRNLAAGRYQLRITVSDGEHEVAALGYLLLVSR